MKQRIDELIILAWRKSLLRYEIERRLTWHYPQLGMFHLGT